jgi:hypothetical protein
MLYNSSQAVHYAYPNANNNTPTGADSLPLLNSVNALFTTSILFLPTTRNLSQDIWEGIRVPTIKNSGYSGFIGISFTKSSVQGNTTFTIKTFYWAIGNATVSHSEVPQNILQEFSPPLYDGVSNINFTSSSGMWQFILLEVDAFSTISNPIPLIFQQWDFPSTNEGLIVTTMNSTASQVFIEADIKCSQTTCAAVAV